MSLKPRRISLRAVSKSSVLYLVLLWCVKTSSYQVYSVFDIQLTVSQTSLNMPGFSLTLLLLPGASDANAPDPSLLLSLLDEPAAVPGWKWTVGNAPSDSIITPQAAAAAAADETSARLKAPDAKVFTDAIERACAGLIKEEPEITRMDNIAGDGDCGLTLKSGAECASSFFSFLRRVLRKPHGLRCNLSFFLLL